MSIDQIIYFGTGWQPTLRVLNALATPAGHRFCQPARYPKKRLLAEAWREVRDAWIAFLKTIDPEATEYALPYDDGKYRYHSGFYHSFEYIHTGTAQKLYLVLADPTLPSWMTIEKNTIYFYWDNEHEAFFRSSWTT
jgi:hypothetical protein